MTRFLLYTVCSILLCSSGLAQQHVFTNKEGVQIVAEIVSVDPDWKKMTIRKDGNSFDIEPNVLILDDQQFVKDWLKERGITAPSGQTSSGGSSAAAAPAPTSFDAANATIDVELKKKQVDYDRRKYSSYMRFDTRKLNYEISVTSGGRKPVPALVVSYALVWREGVSFTDQTSSYLTYTSSNNKFAIVGEKAMPGLIYNRSESFETDIVEINNVIYDGNESYAEDVYLGTVVNIALADGTPLKEFRDTDARNNDLTWADVKDLTDRPRYSSSSRTMDDDDGSYSFTLQKGQSEDGPIRFAGKRISITAKVKPDVKSPDGVVAAIGGAESGVAVFVKDRQVYGGARTADGFKWVAKPTPLGDFDIDFQLNSKGITLSLNGGSPAKRSDVSLFQTTTSEGVDVGRDSGTVVGDYPEDFVFSGGIEEARILIRE